jgi:cysteinyl-tRNA synthetase
MIRLYNTLSRKKEDFQTIEPGKVRMYVCGVTVYHDAHVGHAMSALVFDVIRRYLEYRGYSVRHVMNFTDVDDKIINRANVLGEDPSQLAQRYIDDYRQNLSDLNVLAATVNPRATQTMAGIQAMIQGLVDKGFAYAPGNGDVYFRVTKDPQYGKLSGRKIEDMQAGSRIHVEELKENPMDFALWKGAKPGEPAWDSPWGKGRPGWHIECSAMNLAELGEQIDIHGGGNDLVFPHHENEIAQTESFTGKPFARYWMHNGMLQLGGEKMSKSLGNIVSIRDFLSQREPDVMRMLVLNGSYRAPLMFNEETLDSAEKGLERLRSGLKAAPASAAGLTPEAVAALVTQSETTQQAFTEAMDDDFNSSGALAALFELVRAINTARDAGAKDEQLAPARSTLATLAGVLGLRLAEKRSRGGEVDQAWIEEKIQQRQEARAKKDWSTSDKIRDELLAKGVRLEDTKDGTSWHW